MTQSSLTWTLAYEEASKVLVVRAQGVLDLPSAERMRAEAHERFRELGCTRVLLDYLGLDAEALGTLDVYRLPRVYEALGISREMRMAVVASGVGRPNLDFYETVCQNNGYSVRVFNKEAEARAWLAG